MQTIDLEKLKEISNKAILIAEDLWPSVEVLAIGTSKPFDISKYQFIYKTTNIDELTIIRKDENSDESSQFHLRDFPAKAIITCESKGGLAHELCHLLFPIYTQNKSANSVYLTFYIRGKCEENKVNKKLKEYFKLKPTDTEKAIAYMYLACQEEMTSKITGYLIGKFKSESSRRDTAYYTEMKDFVFCDNSLQMNSDAVKKLKEYLVKKNIDFEREKIEKYIQEQGKLFFELKNLISK